MNLESVFTTLAGVIVYLGDGQNGSVVS